MFKVSYRCTILTTLRLDKVESGRELCQYTFRNSIIYACVLLHKGKLPESHIRGQTFNLSSPMIVLHIDFNLAKPRSLSQRGPGSWLFLRLYLLGVTHGARIAKVTNA